jgi:hypothetical protein
VNRRVYGLGTMYLVGLALLILGAVLLNAAILGLLSLPLFISGIALVGVAADRLRGPTTGPRWMLVGGLFLMIGLLGIVVLVAICGAAVQPWHVEATSPSWILGLAAACAGWPGVICAAIWIRRRPGWKAIAVLWLSLTATFPIAVALSFAMSPFLPRSL